MSTVEGNLYLYSFRSSNSVSIIIAKMIVDKIIGKNANHLGSLIIKCCIIKKTIIMDKGTK